jgi:16S rRNA (guanine966-N2)-methyltransferase
MRIIAGRAGGLVIKAPPADARPTSDRVREAIFSMLGSSCENARVLDLFAGSGALGIEALSRGAVEAVFVEQQRNAGAVIEDNLRRIKLEGGRLVKADVFAALRRLAETGEKFDIIFADPPYAKKPGDVDYGARLMADGILSTLLRAEGIFVLETMMTKQAPRAIAGWHILRDRDYGSTRVLLLQPTTTALPHGEISHPAHS